MNENRRAGWLDGAIVALLMIASISLPVVLMAKLRPLEPGRPVGVIFAPWISAETAMSRVATAGARVVRFGALPFIVVAQPDRSDFAERIIDAGAFLTLDAVALAACLVEPQR